MGGAGPSFGSLADAAVGAGATAPEIVDVLVGIVTIVGVPKVVAAAPEVAMALGHDLDEEGADGECHRRLARLGAEQADQRWRWWTASLRFETPSFRYIEATSELTVLRETKSRSAISRIERWV